MDYADYGSSVYAPALRNGRSRPLVMKTLVGRYCQQE